MAHSDSNRSTTRPAPVTHSAEVQEAKRLEKMQAHASSHRSSGVKAPPSAGGAAK